EGGARARTHTQLHRGTPPGRLREIHDVAQHIVGDGDGCRGALRRADLFRAGRSLYAGGGEVTGVEAVRVTAQDRQFRITGRDVHDQLQEEAVQLGLRERVRALVLDRILR